MQTVIGRDIKVAKAYLVGGNLVAIPTETVYGLAANALDTDAVLKIFEVKNRPQFNPLIVHFADWHQIKGYVKNIPEKAKILAEKFSPGPLTFLLEKQNSISDLVTAGSNKVAVRVPNHSLTLGLLKLLSFPLAAPSANPFGYISPTSAAHVFKNLSGKIPYILDGDNTEVGLESTIIGFDENEKIIVYRVGGISIEQIEEVIGEKIILNNKPETSNVKPETSGQLKSHYAPHTPLYTGNIDELIKKIPNKKIAVISFFKQYDFIPKENQFILSPSENLYEAAKNLFSVLRTIDELNIDIILAEIFPDEGIGRAINDRLKRAKAENK